MSIENKNDRIFIEFLWTTVEKSFKTSLDLTGAKFPDEMNISKILDSWMRTGLAISIFPIVALVTTTRDSIFSVLKSNK